MFGRKKKKSFFEKLTGGIHVDDFDDDFDDDFEDEYTSPQLRQDTETRRIAIDNEDDEHMIQNSVAEEAPEEGQLAVDVINDVDEIIVKTMVAGVKPSDIDVDIARDMVTVRGTRHEEHSSSSNNYHHQELYWGTFSRNILLPEEVDVDGARAKEKHGVLTIRLPKIDKNKKTKLRVDSAGE